MGGVCSRVEGRRNWTEDSIHASRLSVKLKSTTTTFCKTRKSDDDRDENLPILEKLPPSIVSMNGLIGSCAFSPSPTRKKTQVSFLEKASMASLEKAVDVLDTLGSSMTSLNHNGFRNGVVSRVTNISILAFEVANTITNGSSLLESLSEENIHFLKKDVFCSQGVQTLVSTDMNELLRIASADKREEWDAFSREVTRFGNMCKDAELHNLDRFFRKLDKDPEIHKQPRDQAEMTMLELATLAGNTYELYHELNNLSRFEQEYQRKLDDLNLLHLPRKGESYTTAQSELKDQKELVRSLRKKSLWSKSLEKIVRKLVDSVIFIRQNISDAFGDSGFSSSAKTLSDKPERLGGTGLALHYASLVTQIDNIASHPAFLPPKMRDKLYGGLPPTIKTAIRLKIRTRDAEEELTVHLVQGEMEKTLQWLVPVASETILSHQGFGCVGEWASSGNAMGMKNKVQNNVIRLQTLYHADKQKVETLILELVTCLHHLIILARHGDKGCKALPLLSPTRREPNLKAKPPGLHKSELSSEDEILLEKAMTRRKKLEPRLSKSQELILGNTSNRDISAFSRSTSGSYLLRGFEHPKAQVLDVLDGLGSVELSKVSPYRRADLENLETCEV